MNRKSSPASNALNRAAPGAQKLTSVRAGLVRRYSNQSRSVTATRSRMVAIVGALRPIYQAVGGCGALDFLFLFCSHPLMDEAFKIVKVHRASDEVLARIENYEICKAAFEKALFVYPKDRLEMRQGARIILKSKAG